MAGTTGPHARKRGATKQNQQNSKHDPQNTDTKRHQLNTDYKPRTSQIKDKYSKM